MARITAVNRVVLPMLSVSSTDESGLNTVDGLLSRAVNATVTSGNASDLNDSSYSTDWLSGAPPVTVTWPIGEIKASQRQKLFFSWEATHQYNWNPATTFEGVAAYTIEANTAANGSAPTSGWVTLKTVSGNVLKGRGHLLESMGSYNWLRIVITAAYSGSGSNAVSANFAIADVSERSNDQIPGLFQVGDSNTANGMSVKQATSGHKNVGDLIRDELGYYVPTVNAGVSGSSAENWASGDLYTSLSSQLDEWPGQYVSVNLGTNVSSSAAVWRSSMITICNLIDGKGKVPVIVRPIWSQTPSVASAVSSYIAEIPAVISSVPSALDGPNLYSATLDQNSMFEDALHLNESAYQTAMREVVADYMVSIL